jgi:anthranilate synthase component 1
MAVIDTTLSSLSTLVNQGHKVIPVTRSLFADAETPISIYRKLASGVPGSFLLESAEQGGIWSRFSFVGVSSYGVITDENGVPHWQDYGLSSEAAFGGEIPETGLTALDALYRRWKTPHIEGMPPLTGALVGFIGWEAIRELENLPDAPPADFAIPRQGLSFSREVIVLDHKFGTVTLITNVLVVDGHDSSELLFEEAQDRLNILQERLAEPGPVGLAHIDFK